MPLVLLFILLPIAEMWLLITVGAAIGALPTIGLVLLTAVLGLALLRQQGFSTLQRASQKMQQGEIPAQEMAEGIFLAIGGALLLTPGFITDAIGFTCLIPGVRGLFIQVAVRYWQRLQVTRFRQAGQNTSPFGDDAAKRPTIEGEFRRDD